MPGIGNKQIGYSFNLVDIFQNHCSPAGCGGTDDDVAAAEYLLDQCLGITDGMLFVLSWPNRPKGQTNNKRKGEKYGNWSYSYHRW